MPRLESAGLLLVTILLAGKSVAQPRPLRLVMLGPLKDCESAPDYPELLECDGVNEQVLSRAAARDAEPQARDPAVPKGWMPHPDPAKKGWFINPEGLGIYARVIARGEEPQNGAAWPPQAFRPIIPEIAALRATLYFKGLKRVVSKQAEKQLEPPAAEDYQTLLQRNGRLLKIPNLPDDAKDIAGMFTFVNGDLNLKALGEGRRQRSGSRSAAADTAAGANRASVSVEGALEPARAPAAAPKSVLSSWKLPSFAIAGKARRPLGWVLLAAGAVLVLFESLLYARGRMRARAQ